MKPRILVVEDEATMLDLIVLNLESEGFDCIAVKNGKAALEKIVQGGFDLILLDVMLPGMNGFEVLEQMNKAGIDIPVIFLTARSDDRDKIAGLKSGAVDYIAKPFNLEELLLRVNIHLKNQKKTATSTQIRIGDFIANTETFEILQNGLKISEIGKKEMMLLQLLAENAGKVVSRGTILARIWGNEVETTSRTIDNYILTLRKLFHDDPKNPTHFHSIRGIGYKLVI